MHNKILSHEYRALSSAKLHICMNILNSSGPNIDL